MKELINKLENEIRKTKTKEEELNLHLGYKKDFQKGSLCVLVRWDDLQQLLDLVKTEEFHERRR